MKVQFERVTVLAGIRVLHTLVWLFFAGCVVAIPIASACRQFLLAAVLTGLVLVECAVLAVNRGRCPLTSLAGRYTGERAANFDIYLPLWLARRNKMIFGSLAVGIVCARPVVDFAAVTVSRADFAGNAVGNRP